MKNVKIYENNLKKKVGTIALSIMMGASSLAFVGCGDKDINNSDVVYKVKKTEQERLYDMLYSYHYNIKESDDIEEREEYKEYDHFLNIEGDTEYIYPVGTSNYTTNLSKDSTNIKANFFIRNACLSIPNNMEWFKSYLKNPDSYTNNRILQGDIKLIEYRSNSGQKYLYQETQVTVMKNINNGENELDYYDSLKSGDYLKNIVLFKLNRNNDKEIIAYGVDGKGSKFLSDGKSKYDDIFDVYVPLSYIEEESKYFKSEQDLDDYLDKQNIRNR